MLSDMSSIHDTEISLYLLEFHQDSDRFSRLQYIGDVWRRDGRTD